MRDSVRNTFVPFTISFEGAVPWMYVDVKGYVTTGFGNLIDPISSALGLPWLRNSDNAPASQSEIADEWNRVKGSGLEQAGGESNAAQNITTLHLDSDGINRLVQGKLDSNEAILSGRFSNWDSWPADAQLAAHSMAWADGANFRFPKLVAAVNAMYPDFTTAADESHTDDMGNPGLKPRNKATFILWNNGASVLNNNLDPERLYYPQDLSGRPYPFDDGNISLPTMTGVSATPAYNSGAAAYMPNTGISSTGKLALSGAVAVGLGYGVFKYLSK